MALPTFEDLYRKALAAVGGYSGGLYVLRLTEAELYFLPYDKNKKGSFKGLMVEHDRRTSVLGKTKRKPGPAKVQNLDAAEIAQERNGFKKIDQKDVPLAVLERFAEKASEMPEFL